MTDSLMRFFLGNKKLNTLNSEKMCGLLVSDQADASYFFSLRCPVMPSETSVLVSEAAPHSLSQGPPGLKGLGPRHNETASPGGQAGNGRSQEIEWFPVWKAPERQTAQVRQEMPSLAGVFWPGRSFLKERSTPAFIPKRGDSGKRGALVSSTFWNKNGCLKVTKAFLTHLKRESGTLDPRPGL